MKSRYQAKLEAKLQEAISRQREVMEGGGYEKISAYKFDAGVLSGLRTALLLAEETEREEI